MNTVRISASTLRFRESWRGRLVKLENGARRRPSAARRGRATPGVAPTVGGPGRRAARARRPPRRRGPHGSVRAQVLAQECGLLQ